MGANESRPGPTAEARQGETERALEVLGQFLGVAERLSFESFRRTAPAAPAERGDASAG